MLASTTDLRLFVRGRETFVDRLTRFYTDYFASLEFEKKRSAYFICFMFIFLKKNTIFNRKHFSGSWLEIFPFYWVITLIDVGHRAFWLFFPIWHHHHLCHHYHRPVQMKWTSIRLVMDYWLMNQLTISSISQRGILWNSKLFLLLFLYEKKISIILMFFSPIFIIKFSFLSESLDLFGLELEWVLQ